jgi:hypothetical protein
MVPEIGSTWHVHGYGAYGVAKVREITHGSYNWRVSVIFKVEKANTGNYRVREFDLSEWRKIAKCLDDE